MLRLACCLLIFVFPSMGTASDWRKIGGSDIAVVYMDFESVSTRENYVRAWFMFDYFADQKMPGAMGKTYRSTKQFNSFNCQERTSAVTQFAAYAGVMGNGELIDSQSYQLTKTLFTDIIPDTFGETMLQYTCARTSRKPAAKK